jgi:hypothetical protein
VQILKIQHNLDMISELNPVGPMTLRISMVSNAASPINVRFSLTKPLLILRSWFAP